MTHYNNPVDTGLKVGDIKAALSGMFKDLISKLAANEVSRHFMGISFSILFHLALLGVYLSLSALDRPEVLEIREITFMDEVVVPEPRQTRPENAASENRGSMAEDIISDASGVAAENTTSKPVPSSKPISLGERLDMPRKQAPINLAKTSPIASARTNSEVLKVSPARGTKFDNRIANPSSPISLESKRNFQLSNGQSAPGLNLSKPASPPITLASNEIGSTPIISGQKAGKANKSEKSSSPALFAPKKASTFITGQLASRKILHKVVPEFPLRAKREGVGASISLSFSVMEKGQVKENVVVVRTSGSRQWDEAVAEALKKWRFEPLNTNGRQDQTGVITFQFVIE